MVWLGIVLIIIAVGLIIGEFFTGSGILIISGIVALIFGLIILFSQGALLIQINWWIAIPLIIAIVALLVFIVLRIIDTYHIESVTGKEDLVGKSALVKKTLDPEGTIFFQGEYWNAVSKSGKIEAGEEVTIKQVRGLML